MWMEKEKDMKKITSDITSIDSEVVVLFCELKLIEITGSSCLLSVPMRVNNSTGVHRQEVRIACL